MPRVGKHRSNIVDAAMSLFRKQGYAATGIKDIVLKSGAPRGSLYHYFPGGKDEIGEAAVAAAGRVVTKTLGDLVEASATPGEFIMAYTAMLGQWMAASGFEDGCPITTTLLETTPRSEAIAEAGRVAFDTWRDHVCAALLRHGFSQAAASDGANLILAAIQGALVFARVEQDAKPLHDVGASLAKIYDQAC